MAQEEHEALEASDLHSVEFTETGKVFASLRAQFIHAAPPNWGYTFLRLAHGNLRDLSSQSGLGDVAMEHNGGITDDEIEEDVLSCCSVPTGNVQIEY